MDERKGRYRPKAAHQNLDNNASSADPNILEISFPIVKPWGDNGLLPNTWEVEMSDDKQPGSIWQESMRIGLPILDDERRVMTMTIELLDTDPKHSITNEFFLIRFDVLQASVEALFKNEEILMKKMQMPEEVREFHVQDHSRILQVFNDVYMDSMDDRCRNALEVYQTIRDMLETHILEVASKLKEFVPVN